jgi:4-amino-4-deoxy-L-arabinose transferase-like glycosyltransferase
LDNRFGLPFWLLLAAAAVLLVVRTGDAPLIDPDEARFARTSVEMSRSRDLVVPTFEDEPRLVKPPLLHWVQAAIFGLLGESEFTARLPATLATLGMLLITGWVARRRFGPEGAFWAAMVLATSPLVMILGRLGTTDALLSVHILAVVALDLAEPEEAGAYRSLAIGALLGLAFLAKGPVGVILPLLVILAGRTASGRDVLPGAGAAARALAGWCAVVLPWGLVFLRRVGGEATLGTLGHEVLSRFFEGTDHTEPTWYYAGVMLVGFVPWIAPLCVGMARILGNRRDPASRTGLYAGAGLLVGLLFFSLSRGKLPNYILPLAPLVAIVVTWELGRELDAPGERRLGPALLSGTLAAFGLLLGYVWTYRLPAAAQTTALIGAVAYLAGFVCSLPGVFRHRPRWVYGWAGASSATFLLAAAVLFLPAHADRRSARPLIEAVPALGSGRPVVVVEMELPSLTLYLDRIPEKIHAGAVAERIDRGDRPLLVFDTSDLWLLGADVNRQLVEIGGHGKYKVFESDGGALLDGDRPPG